MKERGPEFYHRLYSEKKLKAVYMPRDFIDYALMIAITASVVALCYGPSTPMGIAGLAMCAFSFVMFPYRHGVEFRVPVLLRRPHDAVLSIVYKLQNLRWPYFAALGVLLLENHVIRMTPDWPHHSELARTIALWLFYLHFLGIAVYRTVILVDHLRKRELVREVLMQTAWRKVVNEKTNVSLELLHAYVTGLLTHLVLIAPWYVVITHASFSVLFMPLVCAINVFLHLRWIRIYNSWYYRDHWVGHNCDVDFIYMHGSHHDAIPSGMIGVAGNGYLEGFLRHALGSPVSFYNPLVAMLVHTLDVKTDIEMHQFIPGIYPRLTMNLMAINQHSTHHYGRLEPYGIGMKLDQPGVAEGLKRFYSPFPDEFVNSARLDESLNGFEWDNPTYRKTMELYRKYNG